MPERDYYEILGVDARRRPGADQEGLPRRGAAAPPRQEPGRSRGRGALQGGGRGLRRPVRPGEARALRPLRPGRPRRQAAFQGFDRRDLRATSATCWGTSSARRVFGGGGRRRRGGAAADATCATTSRSTSSRRVRGIETQIRRAAARDVRGAAGARGRDAVGIERCTQCGGRGQVAFQQGFFTHRAHLPACGGAGERIVRAVHDVPRRGPPAPASASLAVAHPGRGRRRDAAARLGRGRGRHRRRAAPATCTSSLHVREHPVFQRAGPRPALRGADHRSRRRRSARSSAFRRSTASSSCDVPAGTQSGARFRLRGQGRARARRPWARRSVRHRCRSGRRSG